MPEKLKSTVLSNMCSNQYTGRSNNKSLSVAELDTFRLFSPPLVQSPRSERRKGCCPWLP